MANEPSWDEIFRPADTAVQVPGAPGASGDPVRTTEPPASYPNSAPGAPMTRRELRESEGYVRAGGALPPQDPASAASSRQQPKPPRKKRRLGWLWALLTVVVLGIGGAAAAWFLFEEQVREVLGWQEPIDYVGSGNGQEVLVTIVPGQIGGDIAQTLSDEGVKACLVSAVKSWTFPKPKHGPAAITFPFHFGQAAPAKWAPPAPEPVE